MKNNRNKEKKKEIKTEKKEKKRKSSTSLVPPLSAIVGRFDFPRQSGNEYGNISNFPWPNIYINK